MGMKMVELRRWGGGPGLKPGLFQGHYRGLKPAATPKDKSGYGDSDASELGAMTRTALLFLFCGMATTAFAVPHVRVSANATPRELFAEQRLQQAVKGLPGDEQILVGTRLDPLLKLYDKQIPDFW